MASDGADLWVCNNGDGTVSRVRAADGKLLWTAKDPFEMNLPRAVGSRFGSYYFRSTRSVQGAPVGARGRVVGGSSAVNAAMVSLCPSLCPRRPKTGLLDTTPWHGRTKNCPGSRELR